MNVLLSAHIGMVFGGCIKCREDIDLSGDNLPVGSISPKFVDEFEEEV